MVTQQVFGIGAGEFFFLLVLVVIFIGPEKLPELSRKVARWLYQLRGVGEQATGRIRGELGPDFEDLTLDDLRPKNFLRKYVFADLEAELNEIRDDLADVKGEVDQTANALNTATQSAHRTLAARPTRTTVGSAPSVLPANRREHTGVGKALPSHSSQLSNEANVAPVPTTPHVNASTAEAAEKQRPEVEPPAYHAPFDSDAT